MSPTPSPARQSPGAFFVLAFALMIPFWGFGVLTGLQLLPELPVAALGTFCPMLAAIILVYRQDKRTGVVALLKRSFDVHRIKDKRWYAPLLLTVPLVMVLSFVVQRLMGIQIPVPQIAVLPSLALCVSGFIGALGEELGWSGYALDPMQKRWGALSASLLLGLIWAVYHYIGLAQASRSVEWMAWWTLYTVANRVIMVWLFNHTGKSVFGMALFHMTINVTWLLFPVNGSYFDPRVTGLILAVLATLVVVVRGPRRQSQPRTSQVPMGN